MQWCGLKSLYRGRARREQDRPGSSKGRAPAPSGGHRRRGHTGRARAPGEIHGSPARRYGSEQGNLLRADHRPGGSGHHQERTDGRRRPLCVPGLYPHDSRRHRAGQRHSVKG